MRIFAINFFLYSLCGENFRRCVKNYLLTFKIKILSCCARKTSRANMGNEQCTFQGWCPTEKFYLPKGRHDRIQRQINFLQVQSRGQTYCGY